MQPWPRTTDHQRETNPEEHGNSSSTNDRHDHDIMTAAAAGSSVAAQCSEAVLLRPRCVAASFAAQH